MAAPCWSFTGEPNPATTHDKETIRRETESGCHFNSILWLLQQVDLQRVRHGTAELQFRAGLPLFWRFSSSHADRGDVQTDTYLDNSRKKKFTNIIHKTFSFSAQIPLCDQ
jgi:hypothetical protein